MNKVSATISSIRVVAEDTHEIVFHCETPAFTFNPGQYIEVIVPSLNYPDTKGNARLFSIASSPNPENSLTVVFRDSDSGYKKTITELPIGSEVTIRGPLGFFSLPDKDEEDVIFIAGGVGIAPFLGMVEYATENRPNLNMMLLYANSRKERVIYEVEFKKLAKKNDRFDLGMKLGYLDVDYIKKKVGDLKGKKWYVSGPSIMLQNVLYMLHELDVLEQDIYTVEMTGYNRDVHAIHRTLTDAHKIEEDDKDIEALLMKGNLLSNPILEVLSRSALLSVTDVNGTILYANDYMLKASKYSKTELVGQNHRILKSAHHPPEFYEDLWGTITRGEVWRGEIKNRAKDGSLYWVDSSIAPIFNKEGEITHYLAVRFPITGEKEAVEKVKEKTKALEETIKQMKENEMQLENIKKATLNILEDLDEEKRAVEKKVEERTLEIEQEKEKLLQVTRNMKGGAILFDVSQNPIFINQKLYEMFDLTTDQKNTSLSSVLDSLYSYFDDTEIKEYFSDCFSGKTFNVPEIESAGRIYEMSFLCLTDSETTEKIVGYFVLVYDITDAKLLDRSRSKLVAVASHQLRTPLTAMRGNVEMLIDESYGPLNKDQHEMLSDIDVSTERLIGMVNDMLDITKIEKGDLNMVLEQLNVNEIIESIYSDFSDYAARRGVKMISQVPEDLLVYGDKIRVRQVFQNLIDNAIKYSKNPGEIVVSGSVEGDFAQLVFKDNGLGVPRMEQSRIFGRFYRASNTAKTSSSGSGLGLYIVRSIISQLGGDIWFESEENVGTTFFITIPVKEIKVNPE